MPRHPRPHPRAPTDRKGFNGCPCYVPARMGTPRFLLIGLFAAMLAGPRPAFAKGVPVGDATQEQWRGAQKTFLAADELFDARRFEEAVSAYRASWEIVASPNTRLQIARCLRELGRVGEAYDEFSGAVADADLAASKEKKYAKAAKAGRAEVEALRKQIAFVTLTVESIPDGTVLTVGARRVTVADLANPIAVAAGKIQIVAKIPARGSVIRTITVSPGSEGSVAIDLAESEPQPEVPAVTPIQDAPLPPPQEDKPAPQEEATSLKPYAFIAGGVGVAGLATFAVLGALNNSKFKDLEDECKGGPCPAGTQSDIDTGRNYQTFANVGLVVGVVGVGTSIALFALDSGGEKPTRVGVGPGSVTVSGRF